jgi:hypothetical protein
MTHIAEIVSKYGDPEAFGERELVQRQDISRLPYGTKLYAHKGIELSVWYGKLPESNGKSNWTAILHRKGESPVFGDYMTIDCSEYPDRVRYEADRMRYLIGEIVEEPFILDYDANLHSGYKGNDE